MKKIAYVFPGQGAQYVGMGKPLFERYQIFKDVFIRAGDLLHMDLSRICLEGPSVELDKTENTQVALLVYGYAAFQVMTQEYGIRPNYMAGHSVGEITALVCSGAIDFEDGVKMVRVRGELMRGAGHGAPGGMAAVIGGAIEEVEAVCAEVSTRLYPL
ncbi:MAG: ACP S-malonyltransferase, partial [Oscillospiraceae bacterium]|nr:ACP S-malonyltransferase [Oscillospiraceae bacterium]